MSLTRAQMLKNLEKARAARKRNLKAKAKKNPAKKKKSINRRSQATGLPPTKRLKERRKANTKKGYFPNPRSQYYAVRVIDSNDDTYYLKNWTKKGPTFVNRMSQAKKLSKSEADMFKHSLYNNPPRDMRAVGVSQITSPK